jgi:aspartate aminotransferase
VATGDELRGLATVLERHRRRHGRRVVLIVDEVYHRLLYPPAVHVHPFAVHPATVLARSFSKDLGLAGERIGYLAVHPELATPEVMRGLELCQRALGFVNAPATMQRMLVHLPSLEVDIAPYVARRDLAVGLALEAGLEVAEPQGGLYVWIRVPGDDGLALAGALARRRVLVAPGTAFGMGGWLRICFTAPVPALERGIRVIGECSALEMSA